MRLHAVIAPLLALTLAVPAHARWPPEAHDLNERGVALVLDHKYAEGFELLLAAYDAMPDARLYLEERDSVFGSMRSSLLSLYETTGELRHLCQIRTLLLEHLEALLLIDGKSNRIRIGDHISGTRKRIEQIDADIRKHQLLPDEDNCPGGPPSIPLPEPPPEPETPPEPAPEAALKTLGPEDRAPVLAPATRRRGPLVVVGATSLGFAGVLLGAMTYALVMRRANYDALRRLEAAAGMQPDGLHTREHRALADALLLEGTTHRTTAIATGIAGSALVLTGVAALIVHRVRRGRQPQVAIQPAVGRQGGAIVVTRHF